MNTTTELPKDVEERFEQQKSTLIDFEIFKWEKGSGDKSTTTVQVGTKDLKKFIAQELSSAVQKENLKREKEYNDFIQNVHIKIRTLEQSLFKVHRNALVSAAICNVLQILAEEALKLPYPQPKGTDPV